MSAKSVKDLRLVVGGVPRVDLLPPEIQLDKEASALRTRVVFWLAFLLVICAVGYFLAFLHAQDSASKLAAEQQKTAKLLEQQKTYAIVNTTSDELLLVQQAQGVGDSTEIDWNDYIHKIYDTLQPGMLFTSITVASSSPIASIPGPTIVLEKPRIATIDFVAAAPDFPSARRWLDALTKLPGFADVALTSLSLAPDNSVVINVTLHIGADAYDKRFPIEVPATTSTGG